MLQPATLSQYDRDRRADRKEQDRLKEEAKSLRSKRRKWIAMVAIIILLLIMMIL